MTTDPVDGLFMEMEARQAAKHDLAVARASSLWTTAVAWLRGYLSDDVKVKIRAAMQKPEDWPAAYHTFWGMGIRNALRTNGFGEQEFLVQNLDNIYVEMVEAAVTSVPAAVEAQPKLAHLSLPVPQPGSIILAFAKIHDDGAVQWVTVGLAASEFAALTAEQVQTMYALPAMAALRQQ